MASSGLKVRGVGGRRKLRSQKFSGFCPTEYASDTSYAGEYTDYVSDNWFVSFDAGSTLPSVAIGRIPADRADKVQAYVAKVLDYENGYSRPDGSSIVLVSDNDQLGGEAFVPRSTQLSQKISSWNSKLAITSVNRPNLSDAQMKQAVTDAFNAQPTFLNYFGHGAENMWAGPTVFTNQDAAALTNSKLPIVVTMDCLNGAFAEANPGLSSYATISDSLLFNSKGGAAAIWASTSLSNPNVQEPFQQSFYQIVAQSSNLTFGEAARLAKVQGGWSKGTDEVVQSWTILGDPMLGLKMPVQSAAPAANNSSDSGGGGGFLSCSAHASGNHADGAESLCEIIFWVGLLLAFHLRNQLKARSRAKSASGIPL